jgi:phage tail sheath protein FI|tara:strand:- start:6996 stop:8552 length:1557 start_codon:yes stop_codon:yes gene_type:complete
MSTTIKTPGKYIDDLSAFSKSVVPVATAIPAFIGYTPRAEYKGVSCSNQPVKITSLDDFESFFLLEKQPGKSSVQQYSPQFYFEKSRNGTLTINGEAYQIKADPNSIYYLYNAIKLFYQNGGGTAYVVSIGGYGGLSGSAIDVTEHQVNTNVELSELQAGLATLKSTEDVTMYVCPEATLLSVNENGTLMESMLLQASNMQTAICIFDLIGGKNPTQTKYQQSVDQFKSKVGNEGLDYGTAYFPFVNTTLTSSYELDYTNFFGGDTAKLEVIVNPSDTPNNALTQLFKDITNPTTRLSPIQINNALINVSPDYKLMVKAALNEVNTLPASSGMAGVMATIDNTEGVWKAPANTSMVGVAKIPFELTDEEQNYLNVDAVSGKSINALRLFNGVGVMIWGARTLDGNSNDWKYLWVRRTMTFIEQSLKVATKSYIFEPNEANTWRSVKSMLESFLTSIWKEGALQGSKAADAFEVSIGLGSTMTADDILNGIIRVSVKVAVTHPAEFIMTTFEQEQAKSS